ncbi:hypothetical protein AU210_006970 [Fusarium oxysporum f. sp. radicis-cucumerinum]|uniref:Uncharacterized protein n=1 Tax=Fusarium oxysporum f. sp. radicis-cucumerinum TaxID=327505 RepID=A0A2H3H8Y6_FUSOX|nr:hypothetical protein AU210_006970 [Fusarium oxysporum f. sp. radicis-cucumerinum]
MPCPTCGNTYCTCGDPTIVLRKTGPVAYVPTDKGLVVDRVLPYPINPEDWYSQTHTTDQPHKDAQPPSGKAW